MPMSLHALHHTDNLNSLNEDGEWIVCFCVCCDGMLAT